MFPSSTKTRSARAHALEQVDAMHAELPWSVHRAGPPAPGNGLDSELKHKLNEMTNEIGGLLRGSRPGSPDGRSWDATAVYEPQVYRPAASSTLAVPHSTSSTARRAPSPRQQHREDKRAVGGSDLLERIFQDVENQRITLNDALGSLEVGIVALGPGAFGASAATRSGGHSTLGQVEALSSSGPRRCSRCDVLSQQVRAIAQSLVGLSARVMHWLESSGLANAQRDAVEAMILEYARPCAHVEPSVAALVSELLEVLQKRRGGAAASPASSPEAWRGGGGTTASTARSPERPRFGATWASPLPTFGSPHGSGDGNAQDLQHETEMWSVAEGFLQRNGFENVYEKKSMRRGAISTGWTMPLHTAVEKADINAVTALLWCGASVNEADSRGQTPLVLAHKVNQHGSHAAVIQALQDGLEAGLRHGRTA